MLAVLFFSIGVAMVSLALTYASWTSLRVLILQQELLDVRDDLFDQACELGCLDDPAYREARRVLNVTSEIASMISLSVVAYVYNNQQGIPRVSDSLKSENPEMNKAIEAAMSRYASTITSHLLRRTIVGVVWSIWARLSQVANYPKEVTQKQSRVVIGSNLVMRSSEVMPHASLRMG